MTPEAKARRNFVRGIELVPNTARLCIMNLYLHGIDSGVDAASRRVAGEETRQGAGFRKCSLTVPDLRQHREVVPGPRVVGV
jgi:hypothetical protein